MKRLITFQLIILILMGAGIYAQAQEAELTGDQAQSRFRIGVLGGLGLGATGDYELHDDFERTIQVTEPKTKVGSAFGGFAEVKLAGPLYLSVQMRYSSTIDETEFTFRGSSESEEPLITERSFTSLEFPILLKIKMGFFYIFGGPSFGSLSSAKHKETDIMDYINSSYTAVDIGIGFDFKINEKTSFLIDARTVLGQGNIIDETASSKDAHFKTLKPGGARLCAGLAFSL